MGPRNLIVTILGLAGLCNPCVASATEMQFAIKKVTEFVGYEIEVEDYQLPEPPVLSKSPTLAQYHLIWKVLEHLPPEVTRLNVSCQITDLGQVNLGSCEPEAGLYPSERDDLASLLIIAGAPVLPEFEAAPSSRKIGRQISFPLNIDRSTRPLIDLTTGRVVDRSLIKMTNERQNVYPSGAFRAEAQGKLTLDCQVQSDYSIICTSTHFDPPENFKYFAHFGDELSKYSKVSEQLTDGSNSAGVRSTITVKFTLPR